VGDSGPLGRHGAKSNFKNNHHMPAGSSRCHGQSHGHGYHGYRPDEMEVLADYYCHGQRPKRPGHGKGSGSLNGWARDHAVGAQPAAGSAHLCNRCDTPGPVWVGAQGRLGSGDRGCGDRDLVVLDADVAIVSWSRFSIKAIESICSSRGRQTRDQLDQPHAVYYPLLLFGVILVVFVDQFLGSLKLACALALQLLRKDVAKICN